MVDYLGLLLAALAALVTLPSLVRAQVLDSAPKIPENCGDKSGDVCATLYFYNEAGEQLDWKQGTHSKFKVTDVTRVKMIGVGSYTFFKGGKHKGEHLCIDHNNDIVLKDTTYEATVIKSVQYTQGACQNMAGVALWLVGAVVAVVVLVGLVIFLVMLRKRRASHEAVPTEA